MGLIQNNCSSCGISFLWFTGSKHQLCEGCLNKKREEFREELERLEDEIFVTNINNPEEDVSL